MLHRKEVSCFSAVCLGLALCANSSWGESHSAVLRSLEQDENSGVGTKNEPEPTPGSAGHDPFDSLSASLSLDYRYPLTGDYHSAYIGRLYMEAAADNYQALGFSVGAGGIHLKAGSLAEQNAHDPAIFDMAIHYRLYFTPHHTAFRPYGSLLFGVNTLYWNYREDQFSGGEFVSSDAALGVDAYVGMGLQINVTKGFHIFGEMGYGGVGYLETTQTELKNELFDSYGYVAIKGGLGLKF